MVVAIITLNRNREVVNLVDGTTLPAAGRLGVSGLEPLNNVGTGRRTGASDVSVVLVTVDQDGVSNGALSASIKGSSVENIDTFSDTEQFKSLKTSGLFKIGRDSALLGTRTNKGLGATDISKSLGSLGDFDLLVSEESSSGEAAGSHGSGHGAEGKTGNGDNHFDLCEKGDGVSGDDGY